VFVYLFKRFCVHYQTSKFGVQIMYKIIHKPIASVKYVNWFHGNPYFHSLSFSDLECTLCVKIKRYVES